MKREYAERYLDCAGARDPQTGYGARFFGLARAGKAERGAGHRVQQLPRQHSSYWASGPAPNGVRTRRYDAMGDKNNEKNESPRPLKGGGLACQALTGAKQGQAW